VHQLFIDFKKAYDSVRREVLYYSLIEFGIPMKLIRLVKMCLNETYSKPITKARKLPKTGEGGRGGFTEAEKNSKERSPTFNLSA
jgi:hypothetical protein